MEKQRKIKILSIIALVFAIAGMSIGFAVFSTTLNISSSATVKPNGEEFNLKIYGVPSSEEIAGLMSGNITLNNVTRSTTIGAGFVSRGSATITNATIDNNNFTISNIIATFEENPATATYGFMIVNEGQQPAYIDVSTANKIDGMTKLRWINTGECIPAANTTPSLVEDTCESITQIISILDNNFIPIKVSEDYYVIQPGEFALVGVEVKYNTTDILADGPFDVNFNDVALNFMSSPPTTN